MTEEQPKYLVVHTARRTPLWMPWATYAIFGFSLYLFETGMSFIFYLPLILGTLTTYLFYKTYDSLVVLFNQTRVNDALRAARMIPPTMGAQQTGGSLESGAMLTGKATTEVDTSKMERDSDDLAACKKALREIENNTEEIGDARDIAWRALECSNKEQDTAKEGDSNESKSP